MLKVIASLREMDELGGVLWNDAKHLEGHLDGDPARRQYVRAVFAYIEGLVFQLKQVVLARHETGMCTLTPIEAALLREESYQVDDDGTPSVRTAYIQLPRNLRFVFSVFAKAHDHVFSLAVDSGGWRAFREAAEIRNRLMHPKSVRDIEVSTDECAQAKVALDWFTAQFSRLVHESTHSTGADRPPPKEVPEQFKRGSKVKAK